MPTTRVEVACPSCGGDGLDYSAEEIDLPFLGKSLETMLRCAACGYRHTDFILTTASEPIRVKYVVKTADDMMVRVVRSSSGTIRIPELGVTVEPGVASEAFVSNVEGIFVRIERVLDQLERDAEDKERLARVHALQERLGDLREGQGGEITLIIEDPFGNSRILADGAVIEPLTPDEVAQLRTGMVVVDPQGRPIVPGDRPE